MEIPSPTAQPNPPKLGSARRFETSPSDKDAIAGEFVLAFFNRSDRDTFAQRAAAQGAEILGTTDVGWLLGIRVQDSQTLAALLDEGPMPLETSPNHRVSIPIPWVPPDSIADEFRRNAFGRTAPAWLGWNSGTAGESPSPTIALLDTGTIPGVGLPDPAITRMDLVPRTTRSGNAGLSLHATAVASLMVGRPPDLMGLASNARLLDVRVLDDSGHGDAFTVALGIVAAVHAGARVLTLCLGTHSDNLALRLAVAYAVQQGAVLVAAAGNDGRDPLLYPARYDAVVAVGAVDRGGQRAEFSNIGDELDIMAPGVAVAAAGLTNTILLSGTSAAAPLVAAAAAAFWTQYPGLSAADVINAIRTTADETGPPGPDPEYGWGLLNVQRLWASQVPGIYDAGISPPYIVLDPHGRLQVTVIAQNRGTEILPELILHVALNGDQRTWSRHSVVAGDLLVGDMILEAEAFAQRGTLTVEAWAETPGVTDSRPANNTVRRILPRLSASQ